MHHIIIKTIPLNVPVHTEDMPESNCHILGESSCKLLGCNKKHPYPNLVTEVQI